MTPPPDEKRCPLCGRPNDCGAERPEDCWCRKVSIPAGLLERVPDALRGKACVCRECVAAFLRETG